eukprot:COSAG01_NODE_6543_length_3614_cov_8.708962_3_plen_118_part_00
MKGAMYLLERDIFTRQPLGPPWCLPQVRLCKIPSASRPAAGMRRARAGSDNRHSAVRIHVRSTRLAASAACRLSRRRSKTSWALSSILFHFFSLTVSFNLCESLCSARTERLSRSCL